MRAGADLRALLARVRLLVLDGDGVLSDGTVFYSRQGEVLKRFHMRDGKGVELVRKAGIPVVILTQEESPITRLRARKMQVDEVHEGLRDKIACLRGVLERRGLEASQVAYMADDVGDLECLETVGVPVAVADAVDAAKARAVYVCSRRGGEGAVREFCDLLVEALREVPVAAAGEPKEVS